jgi:hypothetical protein
LTGTGISATFGIAVRTVAAAAVSRSSMPPSWTTSSTTVLSAS